MNAYYEKVLEVFHEKNLWDDIYMTDGYDKAGDHYSIFESWDDLYKFLSFAAEILEMDADTKNYEMENVLDTTFVFSDEYTTCDDCGKVVRISPDSYSWQPDYYVGDGFIACGYCFRDNEELQEEYLKDKINNPKSAINGLITERELEDLGFTKFNHASYENGWYDGQNDNPEEIYNKLQSKYDEIVFLIDDVGQFDISFSVWVK